MYKRFVAEREDRPGRDWLARFVAGREETERWYLGRGLADPPTAAECRAALLGHMPDGLFVAWKGLGPGVGAFEAEEYTHDYGDLIG